MSIIKDFFIGRKFFQPFFERLHRISLRGMNYGLGGSAHLSGELYALKYIESIIPAKPLIVFDIGGNQGQYVDIVSQACQNYILHSFEPSVDSFEILQKKENKSNVFTHRVALSNYKGKGEIYYDEPGTSWASMTHFEGTQFVKNFTQKEEIDTITLDEFCQANLIEHIHFCKIDVEGHEMKVLEGSKKMLSSNQIDVIQFELGHASAYSNVYMKDFFDILSEYNIYRILQDGLFQIHYSDRYEIFMTTNYLAIRKQLAK